MLPASSGLTQLPQRRAHATPTLESALVLPRLAGIEAATDRTIRLVDDLLDLSCIENGRLPDLVLAPLDLVALVREVIVAQQLLAPQQRLRLQAADAPLVVAADRDALERALL